LLSFAEMTEQTDSEKTVSEDEFDPNKFVDSDDGNADEWDSNEFVDDKDADEWDSVSLVSGASETSTLTDFSKSSVWAYFEKNPVYAPGYNICKKCSKKYSQSTSVTVLRNHLQGHQLKALTRSEKTGRVRVNTLSKKEQEESNKYLVQWLIRNLQPFTVVDDLSFRAFTNSLCSRYVTPDRHRVKGKINLFFLMIILCHNVIMTLFFFFLFNRINYKDIYQPKRGNNQCASSSHRAIFVNVRYMDLYRKSRSFFGANHSLRRF
jgi:hypothetical protein